MLVAPKNLAGGGLIFAIGAGAAVIGMTSYRIGTLAAPGPGLFPVSLGFILAALGAGIIIQGVSRSGEPLSFDWRTALAILAAVIAFAITIRPLGLLPAVVITILVARLAEPERYNIARTVTLAAAAAASTWVIFVLLLSSPVPPYRWPF